MSRYYELQVCVRGLSIEDLRKCLEEKYLWTPIDSWSKKSGLTQAIYEGVLCGGLSEDEAHDQIYRDLKAVNPGAKILTKWTYLEDFPYEEYGDFDVFDDDNQQLKGGDP